MQRLCRVSSPEPTSTDPKICPGNQTDFCLRGKHYQNWPIPKESLFGLDEVVGQKF